MKSLWVDASVCTGCGQCLLACSFEKELHFSPVDALMNLVQCEARGFSQPLVCTQCEDAPCVAACTSEAVARNPETGAVLVDQDLCSGCPLCVEACPIGVISLHRQTRLAVKCDLCKGEPACVTVCPWKALTFQKRSWSDLELLRNRMNHVREAIQQNQDLAPWLS